MSYAFINITASSAVDENNNPINVGSGTMPNNTNVVMCRPDSVLDILTLVIPDTPVDGQLISLASLSTVWNLNLVVPTGAATVINVPEGGLYLKYGEMTILMYVESEDAWYVLESK